MPRTAKTAQPTLEVVLIQWGNGNLQWVIAADPVVSYYKEVAYGWSDGSVTWRNATS